MTELNTTTEVVQPGSTGGSGLVQISQDALNGLLGSTRREAAEKERQRMESDYEIKLKQAYEESQRMAAEIAEQRAEKKVKELRDQEIEKERAKQQADAEQQIKDKLLPRFEQGQKNFADWEETVHSYDWQREEFNKILPLLAQDGIDNPEEVLRELCASGDIVRLSTRRADYVMSEIKKTSESLKAAKDKSSLNVLPDPIKPLKPSHVKTKGDGDLTIEDFRKASWLKG